MNTDMNVRQMAWQPELIEVTQMPTPDVNDGQPSKAFIDPSRIFQINRIKAKWADGPEMEVTQINFTGGYIHCMETVEQIANMRNAALGYKKKAPLESV